MKKFITSAYSRLGRFVVIAVAGCIFSACSDFLDVPLESTVATSNFYKTAEEFDMGLTGVYNMLLSAECVAISCSNAVRNSAKKEILITYHTICITLSN